MHFDGVESPGGVRTCLAIHDQERARVTEILEPGPETDEATREALRARFLARARALRRWRCSPAARRRASRTACTATSWPSCARRPRACWWTRAAGCCEAAVAARPFLIKPNREEAEALSGRAIEGPAAAVRVARALLARGPRGRVVSLGDAGAVAVAEGRAAHALVRVDQRGRTRSAPATACSAASRWRWPAGSRSTTMLRLGVACGAANAIARETGCFEKADVDAPAADGRADGAVTGRYRWWIGLSSSPPPSSTTSTARR